MGLAAIPIIATVGSAAIAGYGAVKQGEASSASAKYNSQVETNNALIATQNADYAAKEGEVNAEAEQQKTRATVGGLKASEGASGVDVDSGSAIDTRASAAATGQLNAINIRADAARKAYGYETGAQQASEQSTLDKFESGNDSTAGLINSGSTILGGLGQAGSQYSQFKQSGLLDTSGE